MAQRRMVSVKIIDSAKFVKMPPSTQALYFHLVARADDDGVVEAFNVMRMIGSAEDDIKLLSLKQFIVILNDDLVSFISDWHEHNLIRADRKIDSMYQDLLIQIVGDVQLKQKKERADRRKPLEIGTSHGQPTDGIGKVRLGQSSIENTFVEIPFTEIIDKPKSDYERIYNYYNSLGLIVHRALTEDMKKAIDTAKKQLKCDDNRLIELLDRHKADVQATKNKDFKVKPRSLSEFFGQKQFGGVALICAKYDTGDKPKQSIGYGVIDDCDDLEDIL